MRTFIKWHINGVSCSISVAIIIKFLNRNLRDDSNFFFSDAYFTSNKTKVIRNLLKETQLVNSKQS